MLRWRWARSSDCAFMSTRPAYLTHPGRRTSRPLPRVLADADERFGRVTGRAGERKRGDRELRYSTLALRAEFAVEPSIGFSGVHRIRLAAIGTAQDPFMLPLCQHQLHCLLAFGADRRGGLDLRHDAFVGGSTTLSVTDKCRRRGGDGRNYIPVMFGRRLKTKVGHH